jgi:hypothetical protein
VNQIIDVEKVIQAIRLLRAKRLDLLSRLPDNPLERGRVLWALTDEVVAQVGINDHLTKTAVDMLILIFDKPYADSVYTSLMSDLEKISKLKLQELKLVPRSMYEVKLELKLQRLPQDEFKQHVQTLKSLKFRFDDILKQWYKIYEAGRPVAHPLT